MRKIADFCPFTAYFGDFEGVFCMNTFLFICKLINPPASASWETEVADYVSFKGSIIQKIKIFFYLQKLNVKGVFWYNGCVKMIIGGQIYAI